MNPTPALKVMHDSPEAARLVTVTGWVSRHGRFFGDDEQIARYDGCTHRRCECGGDAEKSSSHCPACRAERDRARYEALPYREWDGETPLTLYDDDRFFWDEDDLLSYCEEHDIEAGSLRLMLCEPVYACAIDGEDVFHDDLPADQTLREVFPELADALDQANALIMRREKPLSWIQGDHRTTYGAAPPTD